MELSVIAPESPMFKHTAQRTWRLVVTTGPLVAIALTLAAGIKWH